MDTSKNVFCGERHNEVFLQESRSRKIKSWSKTANLPEGFLKDYAIMASTDPS